MNTPRFYSLTEESKIRCRLCPRECLLPPDCRGSCGVRFNRNGKLELPFYGFISSLALDPIEKKPLYHFRPGSKIFSLGSTGCNLHCPFCQNWQISQNTAIPGQVYSPEELISAAVKAATRSIAYTYSEPLVHVEFLLDTMKEGRKAGIANVLVSNGCINSEAAAEVLDLVDAANIDLKSFSEKTYKEVLGGDLSAVINFIEMAAEKKLHLELTTLVVPGLNDGRTELDKCRDFIAELQTGGTTVPWHLSAYHPDYEWNAPATDPDFLIAAARRAREKIAYVYTGNLNPAEGDLNFNDTFCRQCGETLVRRRNYRIDTSGLAVKEAGGKPAYFCSDCGEKAPVV